MNAKSFFHKLLSGGGLVISIIIAFCFFSITAPKAFLSVDNFIVILKSIAITTVIAMGATIEFAAGIFDMSFASLATLGAAFSVTFIAWYGMPFWLAILCTLAICMVVELVNSFVVNKLHVAAFLATLALSFVVDGVAMAYSGGSIINPKIAGSRGNEIVREIPNAFWELGKSPYIIIVMIIAIIVVEVFLTYSKHGRILYMVGSNPDAAKLSGVRVSRYITLAFILMAVFSVLSGMMIASRAGTVASSAGSVYLLPAIAAANIGYSFNNRGKANAIGTFLGAALIGVVENGLYAMSFPYYSINIVKGGILLVALIMSVSSGKIKKKGK